MIDQPHPIPLSEDIKILHDEIRRLNDAQQELLICKQQLDAILNNAPVEIYLKDREGRYLRINKEFERIFGVKNEDVTGLLPIDVHDPNLALTTRNHDLQVLSSGRPEHREETAKLISDQQLHTLLTIKFPVFDDQGDVNGLGSIVTDISEHKRLEEKLRRAQRMDAIGQLTGGICHDFNNILGIMMGNLELLEPLVNTDEKARHHVEAAFSAANRGAELTRKLLSYSRTTTGQLKLISLNKFLIDQEALLVNSKTLSISIEKHLDKNLWNVKIDPGDLEDSILNLSLNALDAMPDGGKIIISTANVVLDEQHVHNHPNSRTGEFVLLSIQDSGHGMNAEVIKMATEPFFTLKGTHDGTGLGLSMVYGFVKRSEGHMEILSEPDRGTDVRIYLPRNNEELKTQESESKSHSALMYGHETILIVDDEVSLIDIAVSHLYKLGYETVTAHNSQEALAVLDSGKPIDLLFADVIMPGGMDGHELAAIAQSSFPSLKVLLTSGYTRKYTDTSVDANDHASAAISNLLRKPYGLSSLSVSVRKALDS